MDVKKIPQPDLTTGAPASPEQAADLSALESMIEPTQVEVQEQAAQEEIGANYHIEASGMVDMIAALIVGYEPKCATIWTDERKASIVAAAVPVMEKYDFSLGKIPPEITLLVMVAPPLYQCSKIIAEGMNKPAKAEAKPEPQTFDHPRSQQQDPGAVPMADPAMMDLKI